MVGASTIHKSFHGNVVGWEYSIRCDILADTKTTTFPGKLSS
jgi:hypothetical protein